MLIKNTGMYKTLKVIFFSPVMARTTCDSANVTPKLLKKPTEKKTTRSTVPLTSKNNIVPSSPEPSSCSLTYNMPSLLN